MTQVRKRNTTTQTAQKKGSQATAVPEFTSPFRVDAKRKSKASSASSKATASQRKNSKGSSAQKTKQGAAAGSTSLKKPPSSPKRGSHASAGSSIQQSMPKRSTSKDYTAEGAHGRNATGRNPRAPRPMQDPRRGKAQPPKNLKMYGGKTPSAKQPSAQAIDPSLKVKLKIAGIVIIALLVVCLVDTFANWNKILPGVNIGIVDVSGMTVDEARAAVAITYDKKISDTSIQLYGKKGIETKEDADSLGKSLEAAWKNGSPLADGIYLWTVTGTEMDATIPDAELANEAMQVGRGFTQIPRRILLLFTSYTIQPSVTMSETALEQVATDIDSLIGNQRVDYNIQVSGGVASVTAGHDGYMVSRDKLRAMLDEAFLTQDQASVPHIVYAEYAPLRIDEAKAAETAEKITTALADGAVFYYEGSGWQVTPTMVGDWVYTVVEGTEGNYQLQPYLNEATARASILEYINQYLNMDPVTVSFTVSGDAITVVPGSTGTMPMVNEAVSSLREALFGNDPHPGALAIDGVPAEVQINVTDIPASMDFETAMEYGIISCFGTYTTEYTTGASKEARNHNIHLMADLLNNSLAKANGGIWSMNDTSGPSDEAHGFQAAGIILENEHVDSIGGGICQVATTVFNAVYEAGLPIVARANHSLYIASYPAGRDAAVSYDDLDFKWENDTSSDILLKTTYTDSTITAYLYGVSPQYTVTTVTGEWEEGDSYPTRYIIDNNMPETYRMVQTYGIDGRKIQVTRTVKDKSGEIVRTNVFTSNYGAEAEIIVIGPSKDADEAVKNKMVKKIIETDGTETILQ